ncbi:hypothetical protein JCM13304A_21630 [Desulfothermus okinawensis JCM 13304]
MFLINKNFLKPTKDARIIAILENLRSNPEISQNELGKRVLISGARVNSYLKELQEKGLVNPEPIDGKRLKYKLTPIGQDIRRMMLGQYMAEIVQIYSGLKENIIEKLQDIKDKGYKKLAFFGASSTCEVVLSCLNCVDIKVITVVDNDKNKHGNLIFGYVIMPPESLNTLDLDGILITSFGRYEEIREDLKKFLKKNIPVFNL